RGRAPPCPPPFPYTTLFRSRGQGIRAFLQGDQGGAVMSRAADPIVADAVLQAGLVGVLPYVLRAVIGETLQGWQLAGSEPLGLRSEEHTSELQSRENLVCRL